MLDELTEDQRAAVKRSVLNGRYHLLLGAGASLGCTSTTGAPLPGAMELAKQLSDHFKVEMETGDLLWRVYERAVSKSGAKSVYVWLRELFGGVNPASWFATLARLNWDTIWTLNLDDAFENAYREMATDWSRRLRSLSWDDDYCEGQFLRVVHLHGHVMDTDPRPLVLSLSEYAAAGVSRSAWPVTFPDVYGVSPFIIIGARIRDEPDIEAVVARRRPTHAAPSFYVNPSISEAVATDLQAWNLVPIRMTGEQFIDALADEVGIDLSTVPRKDLEVGMRVGRQFVERVTDKTVVVPKGHDLLSGDEPLWQDIQARVHVEFSWIQEKASLIEQQSRDGAKALVCVSPRLTGRSTGLLAIGRRLRASGWRVLEHVGSEVLDVEAIVAFASEEPAVALLFDGVAFIADDLDRLVRRARELHVPLVCVAVETDSKSPALLGRLSDANLVYGRLHEVPSRMTRADAGHLVDHLARRGRLGTLESLKYDSARVKALSGRSVFEAMATVTDAPAFGVRVAALVDAISTNEARELLLVSALANRVERPLNLMDAALFLGVRSESISTIANQPGMPDLVTIRERYVHTRQRFLALQRIIEVMGSEAAQHLLAAGLARLSVRLGTSSTRERNETYLLVAALMRYKLIVQVFGVTELEAWYAGLEPSFGSWSSRYWEQRAIANRHTGGDMDKSLVLSESFARRAVTLHMDSFSLTTLGTVLAARAVAADLGGARHYYEECWKTFQTASQLDPTNVVCWLAYLDHVLPLIEKLKNESGPSDTEFHREACSDWETTLAGLENLAGRSDSLSSDVRRLRDRFERL